MWPIYLVVLGFLVFFGFIGFSMFRGEKKHKADLAAQAALVEAEQARLAALSPEALAAEMAIAKANKEAEQAATQDHRNTILHGPLNPVMVCPHCAEKGHVRTHSVTLKKGVSGGKATAAILTGGVSLLATGLSRKEDNTQAWCENCTNQWIF